MMMRLFIGVWVCLVALGASFGALQWKVGEAEKAEAAKVEKKRPPELRRLKSITVPLIANGAVQGYLVTQLAYLADGEALKAIDVTPDPFVQDEAFRLLYGDEKLDYRNLDRFDLGRFSAAVKQGVRARLKSDVVSDVLVQEFNFVAHEDVRR